MSISGSLWAAVHRELRRPNVTLALLWEEYRSGASDGFGYSWFCDLYRAWVGRLKPTLRQVHLAGDKLFVAVAGHRMEVFDGGLLLDREATNRARAGQDLYLSRDHDQPTSGGVS